MLARELIYGWSLRKLIKSYVLFHHISCVLRYICTPSILQFLYLKRGANVLKIKYTQTKTLHTQSVTRLIQYIPIFTSEVSKTHQVILFVSKVNTCVVFSEAIDSVLEVIQLSSESIASESNHN